MNAKNIFFITIVFLIGILNSCYVINTVDNSTPTPTPTPIEKERIIDVNYLADEIKNEVECTFNANPDGLLITEVTRDWIEIFNTNAPGSDPICLGQYQLRSSWKGNYSAIYKDSLQNYPIEPQSYAVIRFNGEVGNISSDLLIVKGPGLQNYKGQYVGVFELIRSNETVDFIAFCLDKNPITSPTTGKFSGCVDYRSSEYLSFSRSSLVDTDASSDWRSSTIPTFGGPNDVIDDTDNDQDGIPDANERPGTTFAGMPLYEWGARENQRDIFIHINYMDGRERRRGLTPWKESLDLISKTFAKNDYKIHFDVGNLHSSSINPSNYNMSGADHEVLHSTYITIYENVYTGAQIPEGELFSVIYYKNRYMPINRFGLFHYALFANIYADGDVDGDTLGIAELPGNDFLLLLGGSGYYDKLSETHRHNFTASVFFHELGHNLGLKHGGDVDDNYKPNHFSIMNYGYAFRGVPVTNDNNTNNFFNRYLIEFQEVDLRLTLNNDIIQETFNLDYSHGVFPDLDESKLFETNPLGRLLGDIDWNNDGTIQTNSYSYNLNPLDTRRNDIRVLSDYNEWANLALPFDYEKREYRSLRSRSSGISPRFEHLRQEGTSPTIKCDFGLPHTFDLPHTH